VRQYVTVAGSGASRITGAAPVLLTMEQLTTLRDVTVSNDHPATGGTTVKGLSSVEFVDANIEARGKQPIAVDALYVTANGSRFRASDTENYSGRALVVRSWAQINGSEIDSTEDRGGLELLGSSAEVTDSVLGGSAYATTVDGARLILRNVTGVEEIHVQRTGTKATLRGSEVDAMFVSALATADVADSDVRYLRVSGASPTSVTVRQSRIDQLIAAYGGDFDALHTDVRLVNAADAGAGTYGSLHMSRVHTVTAAAGTSLDCRGSVFLTVDSC
jgi:hypothetical protein